MPGVRINQFLASTAVVLLLAGAPAVTLRRRPNATAARQTPRLPRPTPADADKTPAATATPQPLDSPNLPATSGIVHRPIRRSRPLPRRQPLRRPRLRNPQRRPARRRRLRPQQRRLRPP